jgi:hypothetical protein
MRRARTGWHPSCAGVAAAVLAVLVPGAAAAASRARCNGEVRLCARPLNRVVLATAHNAMSARSLGWRNPDQPVGIPEQLRLGIRGFLLDTYYAHRDAHGMIVKDDVPTPQSRLYLCHVACQLGSTPLIDVLRTMRRFLAAHPRNVLVIVNEDYVRPRDFAREVRRSGLLHHVYRGRPGPRWPTLQAMIRRRAQVVVLAEHHAAGVPWYHEAYRGILQETNYEWPHPAAIVRPRRWARSCRPNRGGRRGSLFLMNHWSPPYAPTPAGSARVNATSVLVGRARACRRGRGRLPNLLAVDMVTSGGLLRAVHRLNTLAGAR